MKPQITKKQLSLLKKNMYETWKHLIDLQLVSQQNPERQQVPWGFVKQYITAVHHVLYSIICILESLNCPSLGLINLSCSHLASLDPRLGQLIEHKPQILSLTLFALDKIVKKVSKDFLTILPSWSINGFSTWLDTICMGSWTFIEIATIICLSIILIKRAPDLTKKMIVLMEKLMFLAIFSVFVATV